MLEKNSNDQTSRANLEDKKLDINDLKQHYAFKDFNERQLNEARDSLFELAILLLGELNEKASE